jgi:DUF971 family protein
MLNPVKVESIAGATLVITWEDGRTDVLPASLLRAACPCAGCRDPGHEPPSGAGADLRQVRVVGGYALGFTFGPDNHETGIFPYDLLRRLGEG